MTRTPCSSWPDAQCECLRVLEPQWSPSLTPPEREALTRRCAERGIAALSLAVDRGYNNLGRIERDAQTMLSLGNLRDCPGFAEIVARVKARRRRPPIELRRRNSRPVPSRRAHRKSIFGNNGAGLPPVIGAVTLSSVGNGGLAASA